MELCTLKTIKSWLRIGRKILKILGKKSNVYLDKVLLVLVEHEVVVHHVAGGDVVQAKVTQQQPVLIMTIIKGSVHQFYKIKIYLYLFI